MTGLALVPSLDLLDCTVRHEPPQYPRHQLLMQSNSPLDGGEAEWYGASAHSLADEHFSFCQLKAITFGAMRDAA